MIMDALKDVDRRLGWTLRAFTVSLLVALSVLVTSNIVARYTGWASMSWFDEVVSTLFAWFVFIGAGALWREREHFAICLMPPHFEQTLTGRAAALLIALIGVGFALALLYYGWSYVGRVDATTPVLGWPQAYAYACLPISGALMSAYALRDLWQVLTRPGPAPAA
ncbi:MAG: TRAP transporter small permease [Rubrivivax sp.]